MREPAWQLRPEISIDLRGLLMRGSIDLRGLLPSVDLRGPLVQPHGPAWSAAVARKDRRKLFLKAWFLVLYIGFCYLYVDPLPF